MSTVKFEPFSFEEEEVTDFSPETLEVVDETKEEGKEKSQTESNKSTETNKEDEKSEVAVDIEETEEDNEVDNDNPDPLGLFNKSGKKSDKEDKGTGKEDSKKVTSEDVDYQGLTEFLIATEVWKDFEGKEKLEYNEETFQALWKAQAENKAKESLNEERSQFGETANQLFDFLKSGGDITDFVSNYTQQLDIESIDTNTESGQEQVIKEYYKSIDWPDAKIKKFLERVKDDSELKEEAEDCKAKLKQAFDSDREQMVREQQAIDEDKRLRKQAFDRSVRELIYKDESLAEREKTELDNFIFKPKFQDKEGNKYTEYQVKIHEINSDPKKYQKYLKFIKDIDSFENKEVAKKEAVKNTFKFLKNGGSNPLEGAQSKELVKHKQEGIPAAFKFK